MPTHYKGSAREVRALDVFVKLSRASETLGTRLMQGLTEFDLTPGQLGVLEALLHLGRMSQRELGRKLLRSDPSITAVLDNLARDGLIRRERSPEDRRVVFVSLTSEGRRRIERAFPAHAQRIADLLSVLDDAEQEQLGRLCRKLGLGIVSSAGTLKADRFSGVSRSRSAGVSPATGNAR